MIFRTEKNDKQYSLKNIKSIKLEYLDHRYILDVKQKRVRYQNITHRLHPVRTISNSFFDEKYALIDSEIFQRIEGIFAVLVLEVPLEKRLEFPNGCTPNAFMSIEMEKTLKNCLSLNEVWYYTNTHFDREHFTVFTEPVAEAFLRLVNLLDGFCVFPEYSAEYAGEPVILSTEVTSHLKYRFESLASVSIKRITGYQYSATGVFGCDFYYNQEKVCSASSAPFSFSFVTMRGFGQIWESRFEEQTIGMGTTRCVLETVTKEQVAKIMYWELGKYEMNDSLLVYCDRNRYRFFLEDELIGQINAYEEEITQRPVNLAYYDCNMFYEVLLAEGLTADLELLIMAFPMLII